MVRAALRTAYPSVHLRPFTARFGRPPYLLRLEKRHEFIRRLAVLERDGLDDPLTDRLLTAMAATGGPAFVQLALTPTPALFERWAKALYYTVENPEDRLYVPDHFLPLCWWFTER